MKWMSGTSLLLSIHLFLFCAQHAFATQINAPADGAQPPTAAWSSIDVHHVYGFPDAKAKEKGTLTVNANGVSFVGKSGQAMISSSSILAVESNNQRVELWGMKGSILRKAIPLGGGLVAATFMHHRVDMLTVEFTDRMGAYHGAVFFLPAKEADKAIQAFAKLPVADRERPGNACEGRPVRQGTVLVSAPNWDQVDIPAPYRALVYEHLVERLGRQKGIRRVYRDGETGPETGCPQYTIGLSITGFKPGSSVQRAWTGPVGMFVGTTQMVFDATITDASGKMNLHEQTKATVRGESESTNVADGVAKKLTKQFSVERKKADETGGGKKPEQARIP